MSTATPMGIERRRQVYLRGRKRPTARQQQRMRHKWNRAMGGRHQL